MIDKQDLIDKLGKRGAVEFMQNHRSNQPTGFDRTRGIKGRIRHRRCEHGIWVIQDYEPKRCVKCHGKPKNTKSKDFRPYFNMGLGAYVESRSEEKKLAKSLGLGEAG